MYMYMYKIGYLNWIYTAILKVVVFWGEREGDIIIEIPQEFANLNLQINTVNN